MINTKFMQATIPSLPMQTSSEVRQDSNSMHGHREDRGPHHQSLSPTRRVQKVVEFNVPVAKRQRPNTEITAQNITVAIQHGVTDHIRREAIHNACAAFDHGVQIAHDDEIRVGADTAIFKHLTFLLFKRTMLEREQEERRRDMQNEKTLDQHISDKDIEQEKEQGQNCSRTDGDEMNALMEEIMDTLRGLEMVLRCSADCISVSFARIGKEILPIIIGLLQEQRTERLDSCNMKHAASFQSSSTDSSTISVSNMTQDYRRESDSSLPHQIGDSLFKTATKIIGHFARVGSLTDVLATTKHLLTTLKQIIALPQSSPISVPVEAKLNCLWIVANLACSAENMIRMASHPGLIDILVKTASQPTLKDEEDCKSTTEYLKLARSRSIAIRAILNLSWAHENKIPLSEHPGLVDILLTAALHRDSSWIGNGKGVSAILLQSRRHSAGALRNLAAAPRRYKRRLCRLRNSTFLECLADIADNDTDSVVRDKIHATLYNLVSADTAKLFIEKKSVLDVIVQAATSTDDSDGKDSDDCPGACTMAVQTLQSLEKAIPEDEEDYDALRPVLSRFDSSIAMNKSQSTFEMSTTAGTIA